uniref:Uncharacterized protein n=1 Tax=Pararge aegeria TaxID=116150 RepID=S4NSG3_9NEOP
MGFVFPISSLKKREVVRINLVRKLTIRFKALSRQVITTIHTRMVIGMLGVIEIIFFPGKQQTVVLPESGDLQLLQK